MRRGYSPGEVPFALCNLTRGFRAGVRGGVGAKEIKCRWISSVGNSLPLVKGRELVLLHYSPAVAAGSQSRVTQSRNCSIENRDGEFM